MHRIAVIDENALVSLALALLIEHDARVEVSGLYRSHVEAFDAWTRESDVGKPDAIFFDAESPKAQLETIRRLRAAWPGAVLAVYTSNMSKASALRDAGADLVFAKTDDPRRFMDHLITHLHASARAKRERDVP